MTSRHKAYLELLAVAAIWGVAGPVVKFTLDGLPPFSFLAYRFALSGLFAIGFILIKGVKIPKMKDNIIPVVLYGILAFSIGLSFLFLGFDKSTVLDVTLMGAAGPLAVTLGGYLFFHDRITHREKIGIGIAVIGVLINSFFPIFGDSSQARLTGNLFIIIFLIADSSAVLWSKKLVRKKIPSISITMVGFVVGALTIIPLAFVVDGPEILGTISTLPLKYHLGVWYMAFFSGLVAYFLAIKAAKSIEISEAWLFMYLQPIFSVPLALFWLGESITTSFVIGALIIATGVYIAESKSKKKKTKIAHHQ